MIGVFIPTRNRPEFLQRALLYYNSKSEFLQNVVFHLYDGSSKESYNLNKKEVRKYKNLNINHVWYENQKNEFHRLIESTKNIQEEYILQVGDDDFIIVESLKPAQIFLDSNKDYVACSGLRMSFVLENPDEKQTKGTNLHITRSVPGPYWPVNDPIGCFRSYMRSGIPMQHFLVRNEVYKKMYAHLEREEFKTPLLSQDLLPCAILSLSGNIKRLDFVFSFARQESNLSTYKYLDEIMTDDSFSNNFVLTKELLVDKIKDFVGLDEAKKIVDGEFVIRFIQLLEWTRDVKYKPQGRYPLEGHDFIPSTQVYYHNIIKELFQLCKR
jgi:glycosyltransferase domain-containing protein